MKPGKMILVGALALVIALAPAKPANAGLAIWAYSSLTSNQGEGGLFSSPLNAVSALFAALGLGVLVDGIVGKTIQCTQASPCVDNGQNFDTNDGGDLYVEGGNTVRTNTAYQQPNVSMILIGAVVLGTAEAPSVTLAPVKSAEMQKELGMNDAQTAAFNKELPRINLIFNSLTSELINEQATSKMTALQLKNVAIEKCETEAKPSLSADAYEGLRKASAVYSALMTKTN
jgi:hypothetical protein